MANLKYRMEPEGSLFRIYALRDFGDVKAGDKGGLIQSEKNLSHDGNCWVFGDARVYDYARVCDNAWVSGNAWVFGDARVYDYAQVYGNAWVSGNACVFGNALVFSNARVSDYARVFNDARVFDNTRVFDNAWVYGYAQVCGNARVSGYARVSGNAWVCGNAWVRGDAQVSETPIRAISSRGYEPIFVPCEDGIPRIIAGCRYFTMEEAREHWKNDQETQNILNFFEAEGKRTCLF